MLDKSYSELLPNPTYTLTKLLRLSADNRNHSTRRRHNLSAVKIDTVKTDTVKTDHAKRASAKLSADNTTRERVKTRASLYIVR